MPPSMARLSCVSARRVQHYGIVNTCPTSLIAYVRLYLLITTVPRCIWTSVDLVLLILTSHLDHNYCWIDPEVSRSLQQIRSSYFSSVLPCISSITARPPALLYHTYSQSPSGDRASSPVCLCTCSKTCRVVSSPPLPRWSSTSSAIADRHRLFTSQTTLEQPSVHRHPGAFRQIHPGAFRPKQSVRCSQAGGLLPCASSCSSGVLYCPPTCTSCAFILLFVSQEVSESSRPLAHLTLAPGGRQSIHCRQTSS
jgi:hypothetical protein